MACRGRWTAGDLRLDPRRALQRWCAALCRRGVGDDAQCGHVLELVPHATRYRFLRLFGSMLVQEVARPLRSPRIPSEASDEVHTHDHRRGETREAKGVHGDGDVLRNELVLGELRDDGEELGADPHPFSM